MEVIEGGLPDRGAEVRVGGRDARVICSSFSTHVFRGEVSVRYEDGTLDLVDVEELAVSSSGGS